MPKSYWLFCALCIGVLLGNAAIAQQSQVAPNVDERPPVSAPLENDIKRIANALEAANKKTPSALDERNTKAQEQVAIWAPWMFGIGAADVLITLLGLLLLWRTLVYTKAAANAARDAVLESTKSRKVAQDIGEAQVRAYVTIKSAAICFVGQGGIPFVEIVLLNSGQSPALGVVWYPVIEYLIDPDIEMNSGEVPGWEKQAGIDLASGGGQAERLFVVHDFPLGKELAKLRERSDQFGIGLSIQLAWTDVFGRTTVDQAAFAGVVTHGTVEENKSVHPRNSSEWACQVQPVGKSLSWMNTREAS